MAGKKNLNSAGVGVFDKIFSDNVKSSSDTSIPTVDSTHSSKKVFSFRGPVTEVEKWRIYADAKGIKVDELGTEAITEYIKKHPLDEDEQQVYNIKLKQKK